MDDPRWVLETEARDRRHGVILRAEALAAGLNHEQIKRRLKRRQWFPGAARSTYLLAAVAGEPLSKLASVSWGLDAVAWGHSALALHGLEPHRSEPTVACEVQTRRSQNALVRTIAGLSSLPMTSKLGIEVPTLELAIACTSEWLPKRSFDDLVDRVLRERKSDWSMLEAAFGEFARRGRGGSALIREVLDERSADQAVPLSIWSRDVAAVLVEAGFPRPEMEWRVVDVSGRLVAQVDLAYPESRYAIELDSVAYHLNRAAFEVDRERDAVLAQAYWLCRRFTWQQCADDVASVVATIRADLALRPATFPPDPRMSEKRKGA